jgi:hypothetical protein
MGVVKEIGGSCFEAFDPSNRWIMPQGRMSANPTKHLQAF